MTFKMRCDTIGLHYYSSRIIPNNSCLRVGGENPDYVIKNLRLCASPSICAKARLTTLVRLKVKGGGGNTISCKITVLN